MEETSKIAEEVCLIDDPDELKTMLDFYHDLGIMIRHANMVVLDAQWLINVFKTLITIRDFDNMVRILLLSSTIQIFRFSQI